MIWIVISIAILVAIISVFLYFYKIAFVRGESSNVFENPPKDPLFKQYRVDMEAGIRWYKDYPKADVYVTSFDNLKLRGQVLRAKENTNKTIILFHGYRSIAENDFSCALSYYNSIGMNIVLVDQRSHGKSEGRLITFGVKERYDVCTWVDYVRKELFPDTEIFLSGISMGAATVMMASDIVSGVSGIIADCGYTSPKEIIQIVAQKRFNLPKWFCAPVGLMARAFGKFDYSCSTKKSLSKTEIPILFIHGKSDDFVPCYMSEENFDVCASRKRIVLVDGATHGFSFLKDSNRLKRELEDFIL